MALASPSSRTGQDRFTFFRRNGRAPQDITVKGWETLTTVAWAADGKSLFVSSFKDRGPVILTVYLQGNARLLWEHLGGIDTYAVPSPDGRHLAMRAWNVEGNLWMMENFGERAQIHTSRNSALPSKISAAPSTESSSQSRRYPECR
jgi:Tol biopolymer transport system component